MNPPENASISFEDAYARLEVILEKMTSGKVSLEESLKLYEEADRLIHACNARLTEAEQRIEVLIKNREGQVVLNENEKPLVQDFQAPDKNILSRGESGSKGI